MVCHAELLTIPSSVALDERLQQVVTDHLHMARSCAWTWFQRLRPAADLDELHSITLEALCKAADAWIPYCEARGFNPWREDDPGRPDPHIEAYISHRMRGACLDWARGADHVTRNNRGRLKQIAAAREAGARTDDELAAATGLTAKQVRDALAADGRKAVSLEGAEVPEQGPVSGTLADDSDGADVEGQAVMSATLAAVVAEFDALPPIQAVLLALVYHGEMPLEVAAKSCFLEEAEAQQLLGEAVDRVHQTLLRAVTVAG